MKQNDYKERLHGQYRTVYERVETLLLVELRQEKEQQERLSYLLDVFLSAQEDGVPVGKIVGKDLKVFCRDFLDASSSKLTWRYILRSVDIIAISFLWVLGALEVTAFVTDLLEYGSWSRAALATTSTLPLLLIGFVVGMAYQLAARWVIHGIIVCTKKYRVSYGYAMIGVNILLHFLLLRTVDTFWDGVFLLPRWIGVALFVCLGIWKLVAWLCKKAKTPRAPKGATVLRCSGDALCNSAAGSLIRFQRINKKRAKKHKPLLTEAEFMKSYYEESEKSLRKTMIGFLIADAFLLVLRFPAVLDGLSLLGLAVEIAWMLFAEYWIVRWTTLPQKEVSYLLKTYDRTLFDEDIGDFLMLYARK